MQDRLTVDEYNIARFRPRDDDELGCSVHLIYALYPLVIHRTCYGSANALEPYYEEEH